MIDVAVHAADIVAELRQTDDESEHLRRVSDRAVALLHESGLTRLMTPATYGGDQRSVRALVEAERIVAHGSPSASWVLMVCQAHTFIAGRLPRAGQDEVFGSDPGMLIPGVPSRQGTCHKVDGGYVLNGRWSFASGADHGDWLMVGSRGVRNEAGERCPGMLVVLPRSDVVIDDTWFTLGMRGTGSKDIVLEGTFVPAHRAVDMANAWLGTVEGVDVPLYRLPVGGTLSTMLLGSIVGMAERGLDLYIEQARTRRDAYTGEAKVNSVGIQRRVAEAKAEIAHAWTLAMQNCDLLDEAMHQPPPMPVPDRAQVRWNAAYAAELCRRAAERLFAGAGASAAYDVNVLQRAYRDLNTATHHATVDFDTALEVQGKVLLGVEQPDAMI
jgi:alkylation response protein AidB-like acyl-CoA dehydrogenase